MKKTRILALIINGAALILEALPISAVLIFATPDATHRRTFAYFDMILFGYANFAPVFTAWLSVISSILALILLFKSPPKLVKIDRILAVGCAVASLCGFLYGIRCITAAGIAISLLLILRAAITFIKEA